MQAAGAAANLLPRSAGLSGRVSSIYPWQMKRLAVCALAAGIACLAAGCQMWTDITSPWPHRRADARNASTVGQAQRLSSPEVPATLPAPMAGETLLEPTLPRAMPEPAVATAIDERPKIADQRPQADPALAPVRNRLEKAPERVEMPVPVFPASTDWAVVAGGWVELRITINLHGEVTAVEVLDSSHPSLIIPVVEAVKKARYRADQAARAASFRERIEF